MEKFIELWWLWLIIIVILILLSFIAVPILVANVMFRKLLVRTSKDIWGRNCSIDDDDEQKSMYQKGEEWIKPYLDKKSDVTVTNKGFQLWGEYIDFGFKKAAIIIAGRMEGCHYSYFFSEPYRKSGYNVLVIDNRSHGLSDGKYNCLGIKEYTDLYAWARLLHDQLGNEKVLLHGICIGSATGLYALTNEQCPEYIEGLVADGMYVNFAESTKNHIIERNRKPEPTLSFFILTLKIRLGINIIKDGPINYIGKLKKPILFLYSKEDIYSVPQKGQLLFDTCQAPKKLVWFEKGAHSRIRINTTEKYDETINSFIQEYLN